MLEGIGNASPDQIRDLTLQKVNSLERRAEILKEKGDEAALKKFSEDFESLFLQRLLKEMRKGIPEGGLMEKSMSMEWFEQMFDEAVSNEIAKGGTIGMSQIIYEQLTIGANLDRPLANLADYRVGKEPRSPVGGVKGAESGALQESSGAGSGGDPHE
ncbi:MAG: rod-binding protein [bacterium]